MLTSVELSWLNLRSVQLNILMWVNSMKLFSWVEFSRTNISWVDFGILQAVWLTSSYTVVGSSLLVYYQKYALNVQVLRSVITMGQNWLIFKSISSHQSVIQSLYSPYSTKNFKIWAFLTALSALAALHTFSWLPN